MRLASGEGLAMYAFQNGFETETTRRFVRNPFVQHDSEVSDSWCYDIRIHTATPGEQGALATP